MIFLIAKIFIYLLLAVIVGGVAGWLFRNLKAQRAEEAANRAVNDAKSKVPQLESLLRGRDEQVTKLKDQLQEYKAQLSEQDQALRDNEQQLREQTRQANRWQQSAEAAGSGADAAESIDFDIAGNDTGDSNELIAELSQEISRLKTQLEQTSKQVVSAGSMGDEVLLQVEVETLRGQLATAESNLKIATADLLHEQNKVTDLERERELQNKSLQVLHQQLDLERTRRVAAG